MVGVVGFLFAFLRAKHNAAAILVERKVFFMVSNYYETYIAWQGGLGRSEAMETMTLYIVLNVWTKNSYGRVIYADNLASLNAQF